MTKPIEDRNVSLSILPGSYNVLREPLRPIACWALGESVFSFGQTFVGRGAKHDFARFRELRAKHPNAPIALFGHTDPSGKEDYNHDLGALRARAVYGVLARDPDIWCEMYQSNAEALAHVQKRLRSNGHAIPKSEKDLGPATRAAIEAHVGELAGEMQLAPDEFLGEHGQYSMQSCSEFNPLRRISKELYESLDIPQRVAFQRANRRVLAFFFHPGTFVEGGWPCPRPGDGVGGCKPRFWSDAKARRTVTVPTQFVPRGFVGGGPVAPVVASEELFLCRFYDRLAHASGCERAKPWLPPPPPPPPPEIVIIIDDDDDDDTGDDPAELRQLILMCSHPNHYNSGYLGKTDMPDRIEVVPEDEDIVFASVVPGVDAAWSVRPEDAPPAAPSTTIQIGQVVPAEDLGFFALMNIDPEVRIVEAEWNHKMLTAEVHAYPFDPYERNFESLIERLHDLCWLGIKGWAIIGEIFADGIDLDLFDPKKCDLKVWGQWQEAPIAGAVTPDHRAFFAYDVRLTGEPIIGVDVEMEVSLLTLLNKAKKIPGVRKVLEKVPENVREGLDSVHFDGHVAGSINGPLSISRSHPDEPASTDKATGVFVYKGKAKLKFLRYTILNVTLDFTVELGISTRLNTASKKLIVVLDGKFLTSNLVITAFDEKVYEEPVFDGFALDPLEFELGLPGKAG